MRQIIVRSAEPVTVVGTGPLTNIATLITEYPEVKDRLASVVFMGGSTDRGNFSPYAEFNVAVDPEAADIVLHSGIEVTMCGLNVTHRVLVTPDVLDRIRRLGSRISLTCVDLMTYFADAYQRVFGFEAPPLHDPVAVACVIDPSLVRSVCLPVAVELDGQHTRGATVVDIHMRTGASSNALVAIDVDVPRFWDLMVGAIRSLRR